MSSLQSRRSIAVTGTIESVENNHAIVALDKQYVTKGYHGFGAHVLVNAAMQLRVGDRVAIAVVKVQK